MAAGSMELAFRLRHLVWMDFVEPFFTATSPLDCSKLPVAITLQKYWLVSSGPEEVLGRRKMPDLSRHPGFYFYAPRHGDKFAYRARSFDSNHLVQLPKCYSYFARQIRNLSR